jgi:hypothetical protein
VRLHGPLLAIALLGCGDATTQKTERASATVVAPAASPPPSAYGWWQVSDDPKAEDLRAGYLKLMADGMVIIGSDGRMRTRSCKTAVDGAQATISDCGPPLVASLDGDRLTFDGWSATRVPTSRAAQLDGEVAAKQPPPDTCDRARRCYREGLGADPGKDDELGALQPHLTDCRDAIENIGVMLARAGKPVPESCR